MNKILFNKKGNNEDYIIKNKTINENIVINNCRLLFIKCIFTNNTNIIIKNNSKVNFNKCNFMKNYNNIINSHKSKIYFTPLEI